MGLVSLPLRAELLTPPIPELWELVLQLVLTDTDADPVVAPFVVLFRSPAQFFTLEMSIWSVKNSRSYRSKL